MRAFLVILASAFLTSFAGAAEPLGRPHWSLEMKGGTFVPAMEGWQNHFDKHDMAEYGLTLAYKIRPWIEVGAGASTMSTDGAAHWYQLHGTPEGAQTYELTPVSAFAAVRGVFSDEQWIVPYLAGGWTRMYYKEKIAGQATVRGSADGYHVRGGLQISLDNMDQSASKRMYGDYGVYHTYLLIEAEQSRVVESATSLDLGGTAYRAGLLFEF